MTARIDITGKRFGRWTVREPGTYVTIKVPDDSRWGFGKVAIRCVEGEYTEAAIEALDFDRNGGTTLEDLKAELQKGD